MTVEKSSEAVLRERLVHHQEFAAAVRGAPLSFWNMQELSHTTCPCCGSLMSHVATYPFHDSALFSRQITIWCKDCGFGMVPGTSFSLEEYYRSRYAVENRGDRELMPEEYFQLMESDNPPANFMRYYARARDQLARIKSFVPDVRSMLDVGAGPGYALHISGSARKDAIEFDQNSKKYLDFIGATLLDWDRLEPDRYDVILMSHVLEHFLPADIHPRLNALARALRPGGIVYIEVPPGGLSWKLYAYKHEPHTLFFTLQALGELGKKLGLEVLFCAPLETTDDHIGDRADGIYTPPARDGYDNPRGRLTLICRAA
jgi:SAM-dependent methyltransferase